jgi:predicted nucleic acid-binding protein
VTTRADPGTLVDTNVLIDVIASDPNWGDWSATALSDAADAGEIAINPIVYAELAAGFARIEDLDAAVPANVYRRLDLPWPAAFLASKAFMQHLGGRGQRARTPLPDFLIGAHAAVSGMRLLTRDPRHYRSHFPRIQLLCPDNA